MSVSFQLHDLPDVHAIGHASVLEQYENGAPMYIRRQPSLSAKGSFLCEFPVGLLINKDHFCFYKPLSSFPFQLRYL